MSKILIVEDDPEIAMLERDYLEIEGFETQVTDNGQMAITQAVTGDYDLILLDLMLPGCSGYDVCRVIRDKTDVPILMVTARTESVDKIRGLGLGADDYLTKPFRIPELRARVNAHIRREQRERHSSLNFERIRIDLSAKTVQVDGEVVSLTKSEYMICEFLARNKGQVFTREQIYEAVFSLDGESDNSTIATHIKNIRAKLNQYCIQPITTVWGIGYKWE